MSTVRHYPVEPTYRKDNGLMSVDIDQPGTPFGFEVKQRALIHLPPGQAGGNHSHPRHEAFICLGAETELHWIDREGHRRVNVMNPGGKLYLFVIPPHIPHAIYNASATEVATLIEYASAPQTLEDITRVEII